ncbi:MAG: alpha/beta fold hydrolase [Dehalococcoidia bacterium]|nr:alpha/beta fold hydrolase [Dehalococcoidia bacterium]
MADGLLLLHAFPLDGSMWKPQVEFLKGELPILAPNLPGFGGTPLAGPVLTMDAAARFALDQMDAADIRRAVVCGLSMGGYVALALWKQAPERVLGLVLANTRAGADGDAAAANRRALAERLLREGNGFLAENPPPLLSPAAPPELWERVKATIRAQPPQAIAAAALGMAERPDRTPDLRHVQVPTLALTSQDDTLIPPEETRALGAAIAGATIEVLPYGGHLSSLERPDEFSRLLRDHLRASHAIA